jgi:hypothetical protein
LERRNKNWHFHVLSWCRRKRKELP